MTTQEKFNQILSILPDDGEHINVVCAPLCQENPWTDFTINRLWKEYCRRDGQLIWYLRYKTVEHSLGGTIDIHSDYRNGFYADDVEVLWAWLKEHGFFGDKIDKNLF